MKMIIQYHNLVYKNIYYKSYHMVCLMYLTYISININFKYNFI